MRTRVHELHGHKHARHQTGTRVGQLQPGLERTGGRIDLGQYGLHLAVKSGARHGRAASLHLGTGPHQRSLALWHFGIRPDGGQTIDFEQRGTRHHGHAFTHHQFGDHTRYGCGNGDAQLWLATALHPLDLVFTHAQQAHALARAIDQAAQVVALHAFE